MNILIVYSHPEPQSFNGTMKDMAVKVLTEQGHQVKVSDLYAMKFNAMAVPEDFTELKEPAYFRLQREQIHANLNNTFSDELKKEHRKLEWCDLLIFQFPMWWWSVPAALKGWIDKVFSFGFAYGEGAVLAGKKGMCSLTTGGTNRNYIKTDEETIKTLDNINSGVFKFSGMQALPPFVAYGVKRASDSVRNFYLDEYGKLLKNIENIGSGLNILG